MSSSWHPGQVSGRRSKLQSVPQILFHQSAFLSKRRQPARLVLRRPAAEQQPLARRHYLDTMSDCYTQRRFWNNRKHWMNDHQHNSNIILRLTEWLINTSKGAKRNHKWLYKDNKDEGKSHNYFTVSDSKIYLIVIVCLDYKVRISFLFLCLVHL